MILQLNPPLPLTTLRGKGLAHLVIDYGPEAHLLWVCFLDDGGECWTFPNAEVKAQGNPTMGRVSEAFNRDSSTATNATDAGKRDPDGLSYGEYPF